MTTPPRRPADPPADDDGGGGDQPEDLDALNQRIAREGAAATTADAPTNPDR